jgi:lysozyme family protein
MDTFPECLQLILAEEGGLTHFGISQRAYPDVDMKALTLQKAAAIYREDYWDPIKGDLLPAGLDLLMLDSAVNQGAKTAAVLLQQALDIKADGIIGPITLTRARQAMPDLLITFAAERALRYEFSRNETTFGRGWYRRLFRMQNAALKAYHQSSER